MGKYRLKFAIGSSHAQTAMLVRTLAVKTLVALVVEWGWSH